jgi:O-antigen/teichoic acid export membrane protein
MVQVEERRPTGSQAGGEIAVAPLRPVAVPARHQTPYRPQIINIGLLIVGMGIGQGAIFAVQTWLLAKGQFELLSSFATHYSFAILGIILTDGGTSTLLARELVRLSDGRGTTDDFWRTFSETIAFRLSVASLIGLAAATYAFGFASDGFSRTYVLSAVPGLLFWAGNAVGLLDGLKRSGLSGMTGSLAYMASAVGLTFARDVTPEMAGSILGIAFSGGYLLVVIAQWAVLRRYGWVPQLQNVTQAGLIRSFKDGGALLFQLVPGQITFRVQLVLSATYLGTETTALFAYVKQIITALTMIIAVVLRVDFPGLVQTVSRSRSIARIVEAQRGTLYCAIAFTVGAMAVSLLAFVMPPNRLSIASNMLLLFSPTILTTSFSLMMMQAMTALGAYASVARTTGIGAAVGIAVSCSLVTTTGWYAFLAGELTFHLIGLSLLYKDMLRFRQS